MRNNYNEAREYLKGAAEYLSIMGLDTIKKSVYVNSIDEALEIANSYNKDAIIAFGSLSYLKFLNV